MLSWCSVISVQLNVIIYTSVISACQGPSACEKTKQSDNASYLLSEMREKGLEPDFITCNAAISACEKAKQSGEALELLSVMRLKCLEPDVITCNAAMHWRNGACLVSRK